MLLGGPGGLHLTGQVEIVPADDAVLDEAVAAFGDFLFFSACSRPRGFPTAMARVKLFASSTLLSCFSIACRSST